MPSGLRRDVDPWLSEYEDAKQAANDVLRTIQERNLSFPSGGAEASRMTAQARRSLGSLGAALDKLRNSLESSQAADVTENEKNRRRDLITGLRNRREQMLLSLKRDTNSFQRSALLAPANGQASVAAAETERTAELDNRGLVQLQQSIMREQDQQVEDLERTVTSTKHIALTINEELGLHNRLIDELDEEVEVTHSRMAAATKRLRQVLRDSGDCRCMCMAFGAMLALILVVVLGFKLIKLV